MRELTVLNDQRRITSIDDINAFEKAFKIVFPKELADFLLKYEGLYTDENEAFYTSGSSLIGINKVLFLEKGKSGASIEGTLAVHEEENIVGFIPFAIDSGGWDLNISTNKDTYGQVWINELDGGEFDTMRYVAPSLEEFINGLHPPI